MDEDEEERGWQEVHMEAGSGWQFHTWRMKVPGGWIYSHIVIRSRWFSRDEMSQSLVFVPDPSKA
jgi:hypothetical protein